MIKDLSIKHSSGNQFYMDGHCFYDTDLLVYTKTLVESIKKHFGIIIPLNEDVVAKATYYTNKEVYHNIHRPLRMYIKESWCDKWELMTEYNFPDVSHCFTTYGDYKREEIIEIANALADYVNNNDVLYMGFYSCITYYDMKFICNGYDVALRIIRHYKPFVNIKVGVTDFLNIVNPRYIINKDKLSVELKEEMISYGLIQ